ncbi:hypothetical protein BDZ89DRAFT_697189 [Hymenopellis radicata]|nr:hypothetical protein BDZ89DRAFT_697189 [Hymenopellis radicata]
MQSEGILKRTGRTFEHMLMGSLPEVEVLLQPEEILQACEGCGDWEVGGRDRYKRCSGCRSRYYCSQSCQEADWKIHKRDCSTLATGNEAAVQARRGIRTHRSNIHDPMQMIMMNNDPEYRATLDGRVAKDWRGIATLDEYLV